MEDLSAEKRLVLGWISLVVAASTLITTALAMAVGWLAYSVDLCDEFSVLAVGPTLYWALTAVALAWPSRIPRTVRLALVTTLTQLVLGLVGWFVWQARAGLTLETVDLPLSSSLPIALTVGVSIVITSLVHQTVQPRRATPRWLRRVAVFAFANLILFGLWLPLFASLLPETFHVLWQRSISEQLPAVVLAIAMPAGAALYIACAPRNSIAHNKVGLVAVVATAVLAGVAVRGDASMVSQQGYAEFVPLLVGYVFVCLAVIVALGATQWRELTFHRRDARGRSPWVQRGVVKDRDSRLGASGVVGVTRLSGWLDGYRNELETFCVHTENGQLVEVPRGSLLSLPLTAACWLASDDEVVATLSIGDGVAAAGYVDSVADAAYRKSNTPLASSDGVIVYGPGAHRLSTGLAALMWRPCLLFLIAATAIAIPGLVGLPFSGLP